MLAKVGDLHLGTRNGDANFREFIHNYIMDFMLPMFVMNGVKDIIQAGDMFDVRRSISGHEKKWLEDVFVPECKKLGITWHLLVGNHDITLRNSNKVHHQSLLSKLAPEIFKVYSEAEVANIQGDDYLMLPWINKENHESSIAALIQAKRKSVPFCIGHLEMAGFPMYQGSISEEGQVEDHLFDHFERVDTGHYHTRSFQRNINYLGTPYHLNWQDHKDGTNRGFELYNPKTKETTVVSNTVEQTLFVTVDYSYELLSEDDTARKAFNKPEHFEWMKGKMIKIYVKDSDNTRHFNKFCECIRAAETAGYTYIHEKVMSTTKVADVDEEKLHVDTIGVFREYIADQRDLEVDLDALTKLSEDILAEAYNSVQ